jgi:serine protease Do
MVGQGIVKHGVEVAVVVAAVVLGSPAPALYGSAQTSDSGQHEQYVAVCGWIGVQASPMTVPVADSLGMTEPYGAIFDRPEIGSPAANAGIEAGDVITAINGTPLMSWHDFTTTIAAISPGTVVYLSTSRNDESKEINLTLGSGTCPPERAGRLMGAPTFAADGGHHGR